MANLVGIENYINPDNVGNIEELNLQDNLIESSRIISNKTDVEKLLGGESSNDEPVDLNFFLKNKKAGYNSDSTSGLDDGSTVSLDPAKSMSVSSAPDSSSDSYGLLGDLGVTHEKIQELKIDPENAKKVGLKHVAKSSPTPGSNSSEDSNEDSSEGVSGEVSSENEEVSVSEGSKTKGHNTMLKKLKLLRDDIEDDTGEIIKDFDEEYAKAEKNFNWANEYYEYLHDKYVVDGTASFIRELIIMGTSVISSTFDGRRQIMGKKLPNLEGYDVSVQQRLSILKNETNCIAENVVHKISPNIIMFINIFRVLVVPLGTTYKKNLGTSISYEEYDEEFENPQTDRFQFDHDRY